MIIIREPTNPEKIKEMAEPFLAYELSSRLMWQEKF